VNQIYQTDKI